MSQNLMNDYVRTMKRVGSDDASRERIRRAIARERQNGASVSVARPARVAASAHAPRRAPSRSPA